MENFPAEFCARDVLCAVARVVMCAVMSYTMVLCVTNNRYVLDTKYMCAKEILLSMNDLSGTGTRRRIVEVFAKEAMLPHQHRCVYPSLACRKTPLSTRQAAEHRRVCSDSGTKRHAEEHKWLQTNK